MENKDKKDDLKLDVANDINVIIKSKKDGILFDQDCCTCINLILNNEGEIATSFLGVHNEFLLNQMIRAMKTYFKTLKKALKEERKKVDESLDTTTSNNEEAKDNQPTIKESKDSYDHQLSKTGKPIYKKKRNINKEK